MHEARRLTKRCPRIPRRPAGTPPPPPPLLEVDHRDYYDRSSLRACASCVAEAGPSRQRIHGSWAPQAGWGVVVGIIMMHIRSDHLPTRSPRVSKLSRIRSNHAASHGGPGACETDSSWLTRLKLRLFTSESESHSESESAIACFRSST